VTAARSDQDKQRLRQAVADAARDSQPPLPDDDNAAAAQAAQAWKVVTVIAAAGGMDAGWFAACAEALGLIGYRRAAPRYSFGQDPDVYGARPGPDQAAVIETLRKSGRAAWPRRRAVS
jgi:hypothetical protein